MKTIIYIKFPSSKKDYAYLLDEGADKVPSPGDTLVFCRGTSRYGAMTTNIQVTCLKQVMFIPTVVTAKLCISKGKAYSSALLIEPAKTSLPEEKPTVVPKAPAKKEEGSAIKTDQETEQQRILRSVLWTHHLIYHKQDDKLHKS